MSPASPRPPEKHPAESGPLAPLFDLYPLLRFAPDFNPFFAAPDAGDPGGDLERYQKQLVEELLRNSRDSASGRGPRHIRPATAEEKRRFDEAFDRRLLKTRSDVNYLATALPEAKRDYMRQLGMRVGEDVVVTFHNTIDPLFPELISVGDRSILGMGSCLLTHEVVDGELYVGPVTIGRGVLVAFGTILLPGVTLGDGSTVTPGFLSSDLEGDTVARGLVGEQRNPRGARPKGKAPPRRVEELDYDLTRWWRMLRNPAVFGVNQLWLALQRLPTTPPRMRNDLLRLTGMEVGTGVRIEPDVMFDPFFPERIHIGDDAVIKRRSVLLTHEGLVGRLRIGDIRIGKGAILEPGTCLVPGTTIGPGAHLYPYSFLTRSVPRGAVVTRKGIKVARRSAKRRKP